MRQLSEEEMNILEQMPDNVSGVKQETAEPVAPVETDQISNEDRNNLAAMIGTQIGYKQREKERSNSIQEDAVKNNIYIGANIFENADIKEGWQVVDRRLFGERDIYYPANWQFRIKPATVDAIRNWSTIDDENPNVVDDVFNEIVKSCFQIKTPTGLLPWGNLRSWDRFFILMLIRQYSFVVGESKIQYSEECPECDNPVDFILDSSTLRYDLPDPEVMPYYDRESCTWMVDPAEFDVEGEPITLYLPTLEKEANIKAWIIDRLQNKRKVDNVFIKFLPWMANKISKDLTIASRQIKELEMKFKSFDAEMFTLMNDIINNIMVTPSTKLITKCSTCGEEVTANIRFPNGVRELFNIKRTGKKFGNK